MLVEYRLDLIGKQRPGLGLDAMALAAAEPEPPGCIEIPNVAHAMPYCVTIRNLRQSRGRPAALFIIPCGTVGQILVRHDGPADDDLADRALLHVHVVPPCWNRSIGN